MVAGIPYDSTVYIENAIDEVLKTLAEDAGDRGDRDLPLPRLVAGRGDPGGGNPRISTTDRAQVFSCRCSASRSTF